MRLAFLHKAVADAVAAATEPAAGRSLLGAAGQCGCTADVGTGACSQCVPSSAVIIGAVVGGLGLLTVLLASALVAAVFQIYGFSLGRLFGRAAPVGDSSVDAASLAGAAELLRVAPSSPTAPSGSLPSMVASHLASRELTPSHELSAPTDSDLLTDMSGISRVATSMLLPLRDDASWRDCLIEPEQIQILRRRDGSPWSLGGGAFGTVYKALFDGVQVVAAKVITGLADERVLQDFAREAAILRDMRDKNIVQFVGVCMGREEDGHADQAMMIQEFMEAGDLFKALKWRDQAGARVYGWHGRGRRAAADIARGLHYLHTHKIVHLDIKSSNVLLARDGACKIGDVGLARSLATKAWLTNAQTLGTFAWSAPEVLTGQQVTTAADLYSYGVVLWEIITGEIPTRGRMREITVPDEAPQEAVDLIDRCLSQDPAARPTAKEAVLALERMGARQRAEEQAQRQAAQQQQRRRKVTTEREVDVRPAARPAPLVRGLSALQRGPFAQPAEQAPTPEATDRAAVPETAAATAAAAAVPAEAAAPDATAGGAVQPVAQAQAPPPPPTPPELTASAAAASHSTHD